MNTRLNAFFSGGLLAVLLGLSAGCSSFHGDYRRELAAASSWSAAHPGQPQPGIEGVWEGRWVSDVNGHQGKLRCILKPGTNDMFQARFHATYAKVMTFGYTVPLRMTPDTTAGAFQFQGEANLGKLAGGIYTYSGKVTPRELNSTYSSARDHGRFELLRPAPLR